MPPQIKLSELRAGLASGKITTADVDNLKAAGYGVLNDEGDSAPVAPPSRGAKLAAASQLPEDAPEKAPTGPDASLGVNKMGADAGRGFLKAAQETGTNIAKFAKGAATGDFGPFDDPAVEKQVASQLERKNAAEKVGAFGERAAEFAAGDAAGNAAVTGTGLLTRILRGATVGGVVTKAQGGSDTEVGVNAAAGGLLGPILEAGGAGLKILGEKLQANHIRGALTDDAAGFSTSTLNKYGLSGFSLKGTLSAVHDKILGLAGELRTLTKNAPGEVDLGNVLAQTESELLSRASRLKNAGDATNIKAAIDKFANEAADLGGKATIDETQTLKRAVGLKGAWSYGKSDADSAIETVANVYQKYLKEAVEQATPNGEVAAINKQLGELMPIERAIVKRLPVEARSAPLSLADLALLASGHPVAAVAHIGAKTMAGATATYAAGKAAQAVAKPATRVVQAAVSNAGD